MSTNDAVNRINAELEAKLSAITKAHGVTIKNPLQAIEKAKAARERYQNSDKGKLARSKYQNSDKGRAARAKYQQSDAYKAKQADYHKRRYQALKEAAALYAAMVDTDEVADTDS